MRVLPSFMVFGITVFAVGIRGEQLRDCFSELEKYNSCQFISNYIEIETYLLEADYQSKLYNESKHQI